MGSLDLSDLPKSPGRILPYQASKAANCASSFAGMKRKKRAVEIGPIRNQNFLATHQRLVKIGEGQHQPTIKFTRTGNFLVG